MENAVRQLFERYESFFERSLAGDLDKEAVASFYASEFIAASPAGVTTGKNDGRLLEVMAEGYSYYRQIGTRGMRIRDIRISPIDELHCVAHVAWTASYARQDEPELTIDFDVHYLVQKLGEEPRIFGWISGDEQAVLKERGII
jgi:hypothetical protein